MTETESAPEEVGTPEEESEDLLYEVDIAPPVIGDSQIADLAGLPTVQTSSSSVSSLGATTTSAQSAMRLSATWTTYETYIKDKFVDAPEGYGLICEDGADWWYSGDGRGSGFNTGKYRTRAAVKFNWDDGNTYGYKDVSSTKRYRYIGGRYVYDSSKKESSANFKVYSLANSKTFSHVKIDHKVGNPFCSNTYIFYVNWQKFYKTGNRWVYGEHTKMPHHEFYIQDVWTDGQSETKHHKKVFTHAAVSPFCLATFGVTPCGKKNYQYVK
ncbi:hypothetical protein HS041_28090 [Planomonospora sp. ID67723]|uniref:hypothetical protein n=1 Tax=Planomonospora sp. ID67723 TaxID=2738134 RepID=UPI0018C372B3|nr:hypothetical protein [Planomonospora sp. ID67723]MBG0831597.1 hypothetical protein [Planomonospora sp. ID67723]